MVGRHDAIVEDPAGAAYEGRVGQTRSELHDVLRQDGSVRAVSLVRVLNVASDPQLKVRALSGLLHDVPGGETLAVPFVYHDPAERRMVLVVPPVLAHTAFEESAKLSLSLAQDRQAAVPEYAREFTTVIGVDALRRSLEQDAADVDGDELHDVDDEGLLERQRLLTERERGLAEQEAGLVRMAEELTAREGNLERERAELTREISAQEEREQQWIEQRERGRHDAQVVPGGGGSAWQEVGAVREEATVVTSVTAEMAKIARAPRDSRDTADVEVDDSELRGQPPPLHPQGRLARSATPPPLHPKGRGVGSATPPPLHPGGRGKATAAHPPPLPAYEGHHTPPPLPAKVSDAEVSPSVTPPPLPSSGRPASGRAGTTRRPEVEPPATFFEQPPGRMAMISDPDALWLYADVDADACEAYRRAADLLLQCVSHEGYPVVLLTLVGGDTSDSHVVRLPLDGRSPEDLLVLEGLADSYRARVALYVQGEYVDTITVATLREGVARDVLDHVADSSTMPGTSAVDAIAHVMQSPPPVDNDDLPFGPARRQASSTVAVRAAVEQLESWMQPEQLREAALIYSVPKHVVEGSARRVLRAAKLYGVALPEVLIEAAIEYGVVADRAELVRDQLVAFQKHVDAGDNLGEDGTHQNWQRLFAQADAAGVAVDRGDDGGDDRGADEDDDPLRDSEPPVSSAALKEQLHDPVRRMRAIAELSQRGHPSLVEPIFEVLEALPPGEVAAGVAALVAFGEQAADHLQAGLDSPNLQLRHACALALGRLKLRRSIAPILKCLDAEPTNIWVEIARAMGDFGAAGVRSVVRALPTADRPERLTVVLAHLANHGAAKDVETLENDSDEAVAMAARKAMARRSRLEWEDLAVRKQRTLTDSSPAARFSQGFYAELSKVDN